MLKDEQLKQTGKKRWRGHALRALPAVSLLTEL